MPPAVKITAFFDNKFKKTLAQFKNLSVTPDTHPANRHGLFSVTVSNLYARSIVPFVPEFRAKAQKNARLEQKKHLKRTF